jgi:protein-ribulosamine 3-kinase
MDFTPVQQRLQQIFKDPAKPLQSRAVGGGSINQTYRLDFNGNAFFCKINSATKFPQLFEKERKGLEFIAGQKKIKTPEILDCFESGGHQFLLMEWVSPGSRTETFWKSFGEQLAALHSVTSDHFGFAEDNYMGSVAQVNTFSPGWTAFFTGQRLQPLVIKCTEDGLLTTRHVAAFEALYLQLPAVFGKEQRPALLHGDLWSGNFMCNDLEEAVLIDPAIYFGHPSVDLGMTTLFGGFQNAFYEAYQYHAPFPPNYREQWMVCNLYPLLIHLFLFGRSYLGQIEHTLQQFA